MTAGVGLATMLLGALLVLVPVTAQASNEQAGNPSCAAILGPLGFTDIGEAKFEQGSDTVAPYPSAATEYATASGDFTVAFRLDSDGVRFKDSTAPVYAVAVKKGSVNQDMSVIEQFAGVRSGFVAYTEGSFSNVRFCTGTPPTAGTADLTVEKQVDEEVPTTEAFHFTGPDGAFQLADDGTERFDDLTPGVYEVSEVDLPDGYRLDDISCTEASGAQVAAFDHYTVAQSKVTVTLAAGDDVTCVFTNVPETPYVPPVTVPPTPTPASLTVEKAVTGDVPEAWEFTFRLRGTDTNELFTLDQADGDEVFSVPAGTYALTEFDVPNDRATLVDVECVDGDDTTGEVDDGVVTLQLAAGDDVTCTFTNDFAEVAPNEVTTTTTTSTTTSTTVAPASPTTTAPAVMGRTVTRLPRTGSHSGELALVGVLLIGLGSALVVSGRRRDAIDL